MLELVVKMSSRLNGMSLQEIQEDFGVGRRTAERMREHQDYDGRFCAVAVGGALRQCRHHRFETGNGADNGPCR